MRFAFSALLLSMFLCACNKADKSDTHIYGRIIDAATKTPVSGMPVKLEYIGGNGGVGFNLNSYTLATTNTDKNGNYRFDFTARTDQSGKDRYRLSAGGLGFETYFGNGTDTGAGAVNHKSIAINYDCYKRVVATLTLRHTGATNPDDFITMAIFKYPYGGGLSLLEFGNQAEFKEYIEVVPDYPTVFEYRIRRNGNVSPLQIDSVIFRNTGDSKTIDF